MGWQQKLGVGVGPLQPHFLSPNPTAHKPVNTPASLPLSSTKTRNYTPRLRAISLQQLPPKCPSPEKRPQLERFWNYKDKSLSLSFFKLHNRSDGKETPQSNKVHSVAGRFAARAAERGWRVYLQDEHGTTTEATDRTICMGLSRSTRQSKIAAYAAIMVLERYFSLAGLETELVLPKDLDLQEKLKTGPPGDIDFFPEEYEG